MSRVFLSWSLLLIFSLYWIGGEFCFHYTKSVEIATWRQMTQVEKTIGTQIQENTGISPEVRILDPTEFDLASVGYSDFFLFEKYVDGRRVFYTIERDAPEGIQHVQEVQKQAPGPDQKSHSILLDQMFPKFSFGSSHFLTLVFPASAQQPSFSPLFYQSIAPAIFNPPPEVA